MVNSVDSVPLASIIPTSTAILKQLQKCMPAVSMFNVMYPRLLPKAIPASEKTDVQVMRVKGAIHISFECASKDSTKPNVFFPPNPPIDCHFVTGC